MDTQKKKKINKANDIYFNFIKNVIKFTLNYTIYNVIYGCNLFKKELLCVYRWHIKAIRTGVVLVVLVTPA